MAVEIPPDLYGRMGKRIQKNILKTIKTSKVPELCNILFEVSARK